MNGTATFEEIALPVGVGVASFFALMPEIEECLNKSGPDKVVRHTEMLVGGVTIGIGFLGAVVTKNSAPLLASVAVVVTLVAFYEITLRMEI